MPKREQRSFGLWATVAILFIGAGAGVLSAWLATGALMRGQIAGPAVRLQLGDYYLIAETTRQPECLPLTQHECFVTIQRPSMGVPPSYTVWAGRITRVPASGFSAGYTVSSGRQLLKLPIVRQAGVSSGPRADDHSSSPA